MWATKPKFRVEWNRNSSAAAMAMLLVALVNAYLSVNVSVPSGGQDSWNHYLYARWAWQHPTLLLDQWGKPLFAWQPIVLSNVHSVLTEPSNALVLVWICYLFVGNRWKTATIMASFLPIVRSEGFVLLGAILLFLALRNRWKYMPLSVVGVLLYGVVGALISGKWNWLFTENPYVRQEIAGGFDAGHGSFWHYAMHQKEIMGIIVATLCLISLVLVALYVVKRLNRKTPANNSQIALWLWWPLLGFFFLAHSVLWWKGAMGSHGLLRVFMTVSPVMALLSMYSLDLIMRVEIQFLNRLLKATVSVGMFLLAFPGAGLPYPWQSQAQNDVIYNGNNDNKPVAQALRWIETSTEYKNGILVHQIPAINVFKDLDPWGAESQLHPTSPNGEWMNAKPVNQWPKTSKTLSIWSVDTKDSGAHDWMPKGSVILWDNFHARRDGNMGRAALLSLKKYRTIYSAGMSDADTTNDVIVRVKFQD
ncbi:MAG: hypothetical protein EBT60_04185 [Bacteroidetes bacterium]|nr:hypothetical protein [Bacteroidota bacterium]